MDEAQRAEIKEKFAHIRDLLEDSLDKAALEIEGIKPNLLSQDLKYEYYFLAGNIHYERDEADDAILCYNLALKNSSSNLGGLGLIYKNLAQTYFDKDMYSESLDYAKQSIEKIPDNKILSRALSIAGLAYQKLGKHKEAISQFLRILDLYSEKWTDDWSKFMVEGAYTSLSFAYWQIGDEEKAEYYYQKVVSIPDVDPFELKRAYICKAHRLYEKRQWKESLEFYNKAIALMASEDEKQEYQKYIIECIERMPK